MGKVFHQQLLSGVQRERVSGEFYVTSPGAADEAINCFIALVLTVAVSGDTPDVALAKAWHE